MCNGRLCASVCPDRVDNVWWSTKGVTAQAHYDLINNLFLQVRPINLTLLHCGGLLHSSCLHHIILLLDCSCFNTGNLSSCRSTAPRSFSSSRNHTLNLYFLLKNLHFPLPPPTTPSPEEELPQRRSFPRGGASSERVLAMEPFILYKRWIVQQT